MARTRPGELVGRAAELAFLSELLDRATTGQSVVALVSGDAGVGKTRLVDELTFTARERGFAVLSGRCADVGGSVPYLPVADALRNATAGSAGAPAPAALVDALAARPALGRLLPDTPREDAEGDHLGGMAQQQLFGAFLGFLAEVAEHCPVLVVLEDLHWADHSTRHLVTFLSRVLHREAVALVLTYRTDDLHRGHPLRGVTAELGRLPNVSSLPLEGLEPSAMAAHLTALADRPIDARALEAIIGRAEGNAYYAEEILAASADGCDLPTGLADLLLSRVHRLSPDAQLVLHAATVAGRRVDDDMLRPACGLDDRAYDEAVSETIAHQLLVPDGTQGYAFRHALLREATYADLLAGERTRLHARFAELLNDESRLAGMPGTAAELAHHRLASHDIAGGFVASVRAAREAEQLAAPAEAHRHYEEALSLWDRVEGAAELAATSRGRLAFAAATNAAASGDVERATHELRHLVARLEAGPGGGPSAGAPQDVCGLEEGKDVAALRCRAHERLAYYLLELGHRREAAEAAEAAVEASKAAGPGRESAQALATWAQCLASQGEVERAGELAERARQAAQECRASWIEADVLVTMGRIAEREGKSDDAVDLFVAAHREASATGMLGVHLRAAFELARLYLERGDVELANDVAHESLSRAEAAGLGLAPYGLDLQYLHYLAHVADGEWEVAQSLADGFPVRLTNSREAVLSAMALFIDVARDNPRVAERRRWLEPFWPVDSFAEYLSRGLLAEHALWKGDTETALREVDASIKRQIGHTGVYSPPVIRVAAVGLAALADRAERARAVGDDAVLAAVLEEAEGLLAAARKGAKHRSRPNWEGGVEARGWLARAEAEYRRAGGNDDPEAWRRVLNEFNPSFVYETARSRWRLSQALVRAGRREEARQEWAQALAAAERLQASLLLEALLDLGRRARFARDVADHGAGATAGEKGNPPSPLDRLTSRELEVLHLLAQGRSNREIAADLFIAPKTVSVHVSNILTKLGAASRTQAAAIAYAERPV